MSDQVSALALGAPSGGARSRTWPAGMIISIAVAAVLLSIAYRIPFNLMRLSWEAADSYYSHGFLVPPIAIVLFWIKRKAFLAAPQSSGLFGYVLLVASCLFLLLGDFLGFMVIQQLSFVPMVAALGLIFFGAERIKAVWFPIAFLLAMVPLPGSVTQSVALNLKLFATSLAVDGVQLIGLPMTREGSFVTWDDDRLLVGDICGGLRSLIALLAIGALMAYFSQTRRWAQWIVMLMSAPIAIAANVFRIFLLCVVGYKRGSAFASGEFHDISGVIIFVVAFVLFFTLEALLRRAAPAKET